MLQKQSATTYKPHKLNSESMEKWKHFPPPIFSTILKSHQIQISRSALSGLQDDYGKTTPHKARLSEITLKSNVHKMAPHREEELTAV